MGFPKHPVWAPSAGLAINDYRSKINKEIERLRPSAGWTKPYQVGGDH